MLMRAFCGEIRSKNITYLFSQLLYQKEKIFKVILTYS